MQTKKGTMSGSLAFAETAVKSNTTRTTDPVLVALCLLALAAVTNAQDTAGRASEQSVVDEMSTQLNAEAGVESIGDEGIRSIDGTGRRYVIQPGDTLRSIALAHYGSAEEYVAIYKANKATISDPNAIAAGLTLVLPGLR